MAALFPGLACMHQGSAIRLLYQIDPTRWRVQPLLVEAPERDEVFQQDDRVTPLHSQSA